MSDIIPLNLLGSGQAGVVAHLAGPDEMVHRLKELGLREGVELQMVQTGSPCIIGLSGQRLAFRADEALVIFVEQAARLGAVG